MRIAITGIGIVSSLGIGLQTHQEHLPKNKSRVTTPSILPTIHHEWRVGEVPLTNDELCQLLGVKQGDWSRNLLIGLAALKEAIADGEVRHQIPLINGTTVGGMDLTEQYYSAWRQGNFQHAELFRQHEAHFTTELLARHCRLQAVATISTACSSALNALIYGAQMIRTGQAAQVLVGGTEALTRFHLNGFAALGILSKNVCRPFEPDRDGINLGEGAAYLLIEDEQYAVQRGAHIYGYVSGYANRCDAYHQTASSPDGDGAYQAMTAALQMAHIHPHDIPYINAHGTGTINNDASEHKAITRLFDDDIPQIESTKPLTGHTTSASGTIEMVFSLLRMQQFGYPYALTNAFGFGGNDSSVVLSAKGTEIADWPAFAICQTPTVAIPSDNDYKDYIPVLQARRMTPVLRRLIIAASQALSAYGKPIDGIVVGTRYGGMVPTIKLLEQLSEQGEHDLSPALFMSSTHNTAAGTLARFFGCKGYNLTVVSHEPLEAARQATGLALQAGDAKALLVCAFDEKDELLQPLLTATDTDYEEQAKACILCSD